MRRRVDRQNCQKNFVESKVKKLNLSRHMSRGSDDQNGHSRLFTDAWDGSRTPLFLRFKRDFQAGADAVFLHEDDYSIWQACTDLDQGGQAQGADQLPAQGQNGYTNAVRRRRKRQARAFQEVYRHVNDDRLKEMLSDLPSDDRRGANAWALLLRECDQGTTDLEIIDLQDTWYLG